MGLFVRILLQFDQLSYEGLVGVFSVENGKYFT